MMAHLVWLSLAVRIATLVVVQAIILSVGTTLWESELVAVPGPTRVETPGPDVALVSGVTHPVGWACAWVTPVSWIVLPGALLPFGVTMGHPPRRLSRPGLVGMGTALGVNLNVAAWETFRVTWRYIARK